MINLVAVLIIVIGGIIAKYQTDLNIERNNTDSWRETALMLTKQINMKKELQRWSVKNAPKPKAAKSVNSILTGY